MHYFHEGCNYIGTATNNIVEYQVIINALKVRFVNSINKKLKKMDY